MSHPVTSDTTTGRRPSERIIDEVTSWPGVEAGPGRRGELAFRVGRREIGHLHGDRSAHFVFPKEVWRALYREGRVAYHPVFPDREGPAARRIESEDDVRDVIELMRLNYGRAVARGDAATHAAERQDEPGPATPTADTLDGGASGAAAGPRLEPILDGLYATAPEPLPFARSLRVRAFLLEREHGNLLVYTGPGLDAYDEALAALGGVVRHYLNHGHEAMFLPESSVAPVFVHEADSGSLARRKARVETFSDLHALDDDFEVIPTPGHTPGATAYVWKRGARRLLFTGDTLYLRDGEWVPGVLDSSDRRAFVASLELIRELDFEVLVPWAAGAGEQPYAVTDEADARRRIDAVLARIRDGEEH
jgi:glyoxylase-like metal-dependent hydrolase (beta-lactamase superfamily II)